MSSPSCAKGERVEKKPKNLKKTSFEINYSYNSFQNHVWIHSHGYTYAVRSVVENVWSGDVYPNQAKATAYYQSRINMCISDVYAGYLVLRFQRVFV